MPRNVQCRFISASVAIEVRLRTKLTGLQASQIAAKLARELDAKGVRNGGATHIVHTEEETSLYLTIDARSRRAIEPNLRKVQEQVELLLQLSRDRF